MTNSSEQNTEYQVCALCSDKTWSPEWPVSAENPLAAALAYLERMGSGPEATVRVKHPQTGLQYFRFKRTWECIGGHDE